MEVKEDEEVEEDDEEEVKEDEEEKEEEEELNWASKYRDFAQSDIVRGR